MFRAIRTHHEWLKHLLLCATLVTSFYVAAFMVFTSLKTNDMFSQNPWLPVPVDVDAAKANWHHAWKITRPYIASSVAVAMAVTVASILLSLPLAFALGRYRWPGRILLLSLMLACAYMPAVDAIVTYRLFDLMRSLSIADTRFGLALVETFHVMPLVIFILALFIADLPPRLWEMAQVDGAGPVEQCMKVAIPLNREVIALLTVLVFANSWTNATAALATLRSDEGLTIPVGLMRLESEYVIQSGELMARHTISSFYALVFALGLYLFLRPRRRVCWSDYA